MGDAVNIYYMRGDVGGHSCSSSRMTLNTTRFLPNPCHLHLADVWPYMLALGCICQHHCSALKLRWWALHVSGVGSYILVGPCTPVFGLKGGVWVSSVSIIPIFPANVGYVRQSQQERDCGGWGRLGNC